MAPKNGTHDSQEAEDQGRKNPSKEAAAKEKCPSENEVRPFFTRFTLPVPGDDADRIAAAIGIVLGLVGAAVSLAGHGLVALWIIFVACGCEVFAVCAYVHERRLSREAKRFRDQPFPVRRFVAAITVLLIPFIWLHVEISGLSPSHKYRGDALTPDVRARIAEVLKDLSPKGAGLIRVDETSESREFADGLEQVLRETNRLGAVFKMEESTFTSAGKPGRVIIQSKVGEQTDRLAEALAATLREAGISSVSVVSAANRTRDVRAGDVQIIIKPK